MPCIPKKQISLSNKSNIESQVEKILKNDKLVNNGIDPEQIKQAESNIFIDTYVVDTSGREAKRKLRSQLRNRNDMWFSHIHIYFFLWNNGNA